MLSKKDLTKLLLKGVTCEHCATSTCKRRNKLCKNWTNRADVPASMTGISAEIHEMIHQLDMMKKLKVGGPNSEASATEAYLQNMIELYLKTLQQTNFSDPGRNWKAIIDVNKFEADH